MSSAAPSPSIRGSSPRSAAVAAAEAVAAAVAAADRERQRAEYEAEAVADQERQRAEAEAKAAAADQERQRAEDEARAAEKRAAIDARARAHAKELQQPQEQEQQPQEQERKKEKVAPYDLAADVWASLVRPEAAVRKPADKRPEGRGGPRRPRQRETGEQGDGREAPQQEPQQEEPRREPQQERDGPPEQPRQQPPTDAATPKRQQGGGGGRAPPPPPPSCPFLPDDGAENPEDAVTIEGRFEPFDRGLLNALTKYIPPGSSVLDVTAGVGQLYNALDTAGHDARYLGTDVYANVIDLAGRTFRLRGEKEETTVPALCWADPSRPFDLGGEKLDYVVAIVRNGYYIRPEGWQSFLDNLVRMTSGAVLLAWRPDGGKVPKKGKFDLRGEMARRGAWVDNDATKRLAGASDAGFLKGHLTVLKVEEGKWRPIVL